MDARQRVRDKQIVLECQANNLSDRRQMEAFFPGIDLHAQLPAQGSNEILKNFRLDRSAHISACMAYLIAHGFEADKVMDPNDTQLLKYKCQAGQLYVEAMRTNNTGWLAENYVKSLWITNDLMRENLV